MFQSTRPRGARPTGSEHYNCPLIVSIHAPARGATLRKGERRKEDSSFNPRARAGRDTYNWLGRQIISSFNPRARAGRDSGNLLLGRHYQQFQSTRPRGARRVSTAVAMALNPFQSTRPRGARLAYPISWTDVSMFQSTRPRGARLYPRCIHNLHKCFNPRARAGRDCIIITHYS